MKCLNSTEREAIWGLQTSNNSISICRYQQEPLSHNSLTISHSTTPPLLFLLQVDIALQYTMKDKGVNIVMARQKPHQYWIKHLIGLDKQASDGTYLAMHTYSKQRLLIS